MKVKLHHSATPVSIGTPKDTIMRKMNDRIGLDLFEGGVV